MKHQPLSFLRPTDRHKSILDKIGILLQPYIDQIFHEWSAAFRRIDRSVEPAHLEKLEQVYRAYFKTLHEETDRDVFFEGVSKTVHELSRTGITFGQLMLSFHLIENCFHPYLKNIFPDKDQLIEALTAMDYSCHSCISTLAVSYFDQKASKTTKLYRLDSLKKKLVESYGLTSREFEVLKRIVDGYKNREIADILKISIKTVEHHRASLMQKLKLHNVADLIKFAVQHRIN